jgi:hypothetical protein
MRGTRGSYLELGKLPAAALLGLPDRLGGEVVDVESWIVVRRQIAGKHQVLGIARQLKVKPIVYDHVDTLRRLYTRERLSDE